MTQYKKITSSKIPYNYRNWSHNKIVALKAVMKITVFPPEIDVRKKKGGYF